MCSPQNLTMGERSSKLMSADLCEKLPENYSIVTGF